MTTPKTPPQSPRVKCGECGRYTFHEPWCSQISTKQTPPAGGKLPDMRYQWTRFTMPERFVDGIIEFNASELRAYLASLTPQHLAALDLRRVAEEAGQGERKMLWCGRCGGECELAREPITPAQAGEAPGGGECPCAAGSVGDYEGPLRDCPMHGEPPPTAAPERDAGEPNYESDCPMCKGTGGVPPNAFPDCPKCRGTGKRPAAPTPEPDEQVARYTAAGNVIHVSARQRIAHLEQALGEWRGHCAALRARVAELERSLAAFQGREVRFSKLLEGRPKSAASLESRIVEYVVELQAERDELRNDLEHRTQSLSDLYRIHIPREIELKKHAENAESQCAAAEVAARAAIAGAAESARLYESWRSEGVSQRKRAEAAEAKLEAARALLQRSVDLLGCVDWGTYKHQREAEQLGADIIEALASDSPTTGKDGR